MKKLKFDKKSITAILIVSILMIFFVGTGMSVSKDIVQLFTDRLPEVLVNEENDPRETGSSEVVSGNLISKTFSLIERGIGQVETMYDENVVLRNKLIYINGGFQLLQNKKVIEDADKTNTVYKMENGKLTFNFMKNDMTDSIGKMKDLYDYVSSLEMEMLYIQAPFKVDKYNNQLPKGIVDTTNMIADDFLEGLKSEDVPFLDIREVISEKSLDYDELFYKTDHHWTVETAFWSYGYVMSYLSDKYDITYDIKNTELSSYKKISLDAYLGSQGIRVGKLYGGVDDFNYFIPGSQTDYHVTIYNNDGSIKSEKRGDFEETIIIKDIVDADAPIETIRFQAYFGGDHAHVKIINNDRKKGKLLVIKDSFARPFTAFISLDFRETDVVDVRYFESMTLFEYLKKNRYDMIICIYNPSELPNGSIFQFDGP